MRRHPKGYKKRGTLVLAPSRVRRYAVGESLIWSICAGCDQKKVLARRFWCVRQGLHADHAVNAGHPALSTAAWHAGSRTSRSSLFHLPVIVECNSRTLPQERYNAEWVTKKGYGIVVPSFRKIAPAVQRLLERATFNEFRRKADEYCNRALFEVPLILEQCAERTAARMQSQAVQFT